MAKFSHDVDISAPIPAVWSVLTNASTWPRWLPGVEAANVAEVAPGAHFEWQSGGHTGTGSFSKVQENDLLVIWLEMGGHGASHTFHLSPHGGILGAGGHDTHLDYTLEYQAAGGFLGEFVAGGNPEDMIKVRNTVDSLKNVVEH